MFSLINASNNSVINQCLTNLKKKIMLYYYRQNMTYYVEILINPNVATWSSTRRKEQKK